MTAPSSDLEVRSFRQSDHTGLCALWTRVFPDDPPHNAPQVMIESKLAVAPEQLLVGLVGSQVVAAIIAGYDGTRGWIYHLAVDPDCRRRRYGASMVRAAERLLVEAGCTKVNLQVRSGNETVIGFYESMGYGIEERVSMGRRLSSPGRSDLQSG